MKTALAWLVRLFPEAFRDRFGEAMVEHALDDFRHARPRGVVAGVRSAAGSGWDLVRAAAAERWRPTWAPADGLRRRKSMKGFLQGWAGDLRHGMRTLRRTPAFMATVVGTLGLSIGLLVAIYAVLHKVLLEPLPYPEPGRLVSVLGAAPGSDLPPEFTLSPEFYLHYKDHARQLENVAAWNSFTSTLRVGDRVERVRMAVVSSSLYATLGARPALGRLPAPDEEDVVVLGDAVWRTWFGADPNVIGRAYDVSGQQRTVVGVMPRGFDFPHDGSLLWIAAYGKFENLRPGRFGIPLLARLAPGATPESAATELTTLARQLPERFGGVRRMVVAHGARVVGLGIAIGVLAALAATRALGSLLFGVAPVDPATYAATSALMLAIGLLASYVPARRASRVDPCESLRSE